MPPGGANQEPEEEEEIGKMGFVQPLKPSQVGLDCHLQHISPKEVQIGDNVRKG